MDLGAMQQSGARIERALRLRRRLEVPHACLVVFAVAWAVLAIAPWERGAWLLENVLTTVAVPSAILTFRRFRFSDRAYVQATAFLLLHTIGSHYTYSRTPLGDLARTAFGMSRNHYDRLVHFAFGLLLLSACRELFFRLPARMPFGRQLGLSIAMIAAFGGAYEALEWLTAIVADPAAGISFLGTQGDAWDAQKDFVCAVVGAVLGCVIERRFHRRVTSESVHGRTDGSRTCCAAGPPGRSVCVVRTVSAVESRRVARGSDRHRPCRYPALRTLRVAAEATYKDGSLTVRIPKSATKHAKAKQITVG